MTRGQKYATYGSGILGFLVPTYFAWTIYQDPIPQNVATWSMILLLDVFGLILVYKEGNKKPFLQAGWCLAAVFILAAIFMSGNPWTWGLVETASISIFTIGVVLWQTQSARVAIYAYLVALYVSSLPMAIDYWHKPQPSTAWLWSWTIVTCFLAIYGAEKRDMAHTIVPWAAIFLNAIILVLCLR
jgi:uncharacterized membrane protein (UPF0136 family)